MASYVGANLAFFIWGTDPCLCYNALHLASPPPEILTLIPWAGHFLPIRFIPSTCPARQDCMEHRSTPLRTETSGQLARIIIDHHESLLEGWVAGMLSLLVRRDR